MKDLADVHFGIVLRQLRREKNLTQAELGEACGISYQQIQKYETGTNRVSISRGFQLAKALDTTFAAMIRTTEYNLIFRVDTANVLSVPTEQEATAQREMGIEPLLFR